MLKPTAFLLLAGLAVAQPPQPGVSPADVKRLAERLARLDPGIAPKFSPGMLEAIKKMVEQNPELKKLAEQQVEAIKKLPPDQQQKKLADLQKHLDDPVLRKQLEQVLPKSTVQPPVPADRLNPPQQTSPPDDRPGSPDKGSPGKTQLPGNPKLNPGGQKSSPSEPGKKGETQDSPGPNSQIRPQPRQVDPAAPPSNTRPPFPRPASAEVPARSSQKQTGPAVPGGKGYEKFARMWEQNVGPLKDMPAVQQLAQELFKGRSDEAGGETGALGDLFDPNTAANLLKGLPEPNAGPAGNWTLPDLSGATGGLSAPSLPNTSLSAPSASSAGGIGLVVGFVFLAALAITVFKLLPKLSATADPRPVPGLGPWPLDPRSVETRADLVRAFEYLSVLLNGNPARTYSHEAAAAALRRAVPDAADAAEPLAESYALARYTPAERELSPDEVAAARRHLCRLARVPTP